MVVDTGPTLETNDIVVEVTPKPGTVLESKLSKKRSQAFEDTFQEQPVSITFKNVVYTVKASRKQVKTILSDVSGFFAPRTFTAIMGPSGSGKTTLMDILTQRKNTGKISGDIMMNGQAITRQLAMSTISYMQQSNVLLEALTVDEMLEYTAALYWPWKPRSFRKELVDSMVDTLGLSKCRSSKIGGPMIRGISGGEARRTFIAVALIGGPRVLLLDEPTSGLDSFMAKEVMTFMKALVVDRGLTVVTTIHQPSTAIFNLFDKLMLILRGRCVFFGGVELVPTIFPKLQLEEAESLDSRLLAKHALDHPDAPSNLAEGVMDYICTAESKKMEVELANVYEASQLKADNDKQAECLLSRYDSSAITMMASRREGPKWYQWAIVGQLKALLRYRLVAHVKHPAWVMTRAASYVIFTLFLSSLYWGVADGTSFKDFSDTTSVIFLMAFITTFTCLSYLPDLVNERPVLYHEHGSGLYSSLAFLIAKTILEGVFSIAFTLLTVLVMWFTVQLQGSYILTALTIIVTVSISIQIVFLGAAVGPNADLANMMVMMVMILLVYTTGFYIQWDNIPWYWRWSGYVNFLRYAYSALLINQFQDSPIVITQGSTTQNPLEYLSLDGKNMWGQFGYLCIFWPVSFCLAWLATAKVRHISR